ncbi:MAG: ASCH domain-containing protein, partial [Gammaproteobacteria bacterium]|nr:ASCH domain-containing protein [Gammaproteobacteria bacterium]
MSFSLTERQLLDGSKSVTRRLGWRNLKPGDHVLAVRKAMGLRKGEKQHVLCEIEVLDVRREPLDAMKDEDCAREGFPHMRAPQFVAMFCLHMR